MTTRHTCNDGNGPVFGRKTAGCPRCEELRSGAPAVRWAPAPQVTFAPVPWKLVRVTHAHGQEFVSANPDHGAPEEWHGVPFDPWQRGDVVALEIHHSAYHLREGVQHSVEWIIGRRDSVPSAPVQRICTSQDPENEGWRGVRIDRSGGLNVVLWRIPYRYHAAAARLIGRPFDTKEALEEALG